MIAVVCEIFLPHGVVNTGKNPRGTNSPEENKEKNYYDL